jgi:hypothetical protein
MLTQMLDDAGKTDWNLYLAAQQYSTLVLSEASDITSSTSTNIIAPQP